jgi:hypothetical protein
VVEPEYVAARAVLLDALDALHDHLDAIVLVGAQAIYLHTGDAVLLVVPYTTDADLSVSPDDLADDPLIDELLSAHGFTREAKNRDHPGRWTGTGGVYIDLMVPEAVAGPGRRGADLAPHAKHTARRARGLEGTLVDRERMTITALDADDTRSADIWVAGPGALLVAKLHKISDRTGQDPRVRNKDSLDILRLLRALPTEDFVHRIERLRESRLSADVTNEAIAMLPRLFGDANSEGVAMAVRAAGDSDEDPETIAASLVALVADLVTALELAG